MVNEKWVGSEQHIWMDLIESNRRVKMVVTTAGLNQKSVKFYKCGIYEHGEQMFRYMLQSEVASVTFTVEGPVPFDVSLLFTWYLPRDEGDTNPQHAGLIEMNSNGVLTKSTDF